MNTRKHDIVFAWDSSAPVGRRMVAVEGPSPLSVVAGLTSEERETFLRVLVQMVQEDGNFLRVSYLRECVEEERAKRVDSMREQAENAFANEEDAS